MGTLRLGVKELFLEKLWLSKQPAWTQLRVSATYSAACESHASSPEPLKPAAVARNRNSERWLFRMQAVAWCCRKLAGS